MTVGHILAQKGRAVATVQPHATVRDVVEVLAAKHIGSIVVADIEGRMHGIVSERDVVRALAARGCDALDDAVSGIMTKDVETATDDDGILEVVGRMSRGRFRHMPVIVDGRISGHHLHRRRREIPARTDGAGTIGAARVHRLGLSRRYAHRRRSCTASRASMSGMARRTTTRPCAMSSAARWNSKSPMPGVRA